LTNYPFPLPYNPPFCLRAVPRRSAGPVNRADLRTVVFSNSSLL
jgi:hypothetical protein